MKVLTQTVVVKRVYFEGELVKVMHDKGMTANQLAEKCNLSCILIQHIMDGDISVALSEAMHLCIALGITVKELFGDVFE